MIEKTYNTRCGTIHYWCSEQIKKDEITLIFLPGLTADHRLFDLQIEYFEPKVNVFVWDAPAHAASRPFSFDFELKDKAKWLNEIMEKEWFENPVLVGQSMGGYVGQTFLELFPGKLKGFISIDSAPLQRQYVAGIEIWLLKRTKPMFKIFPWKLLLWAGSKGVASTKYGQSLMREMMMVYNDDPKYYVQLSSHGFNMLAEAMEEDLPNQIDCPALLICGKKDHAGSCKRYCKAWHKNTGIPIEWIENAGHNSNTDQPEIINDLIENMVEKFALTKKSCYNKMNK